MNLLTGILILGSFACMCAIQTADNKKLSKRIADLEKEVFPEVVDGKKSD